MMPMNDGNKNIKKISISYSALKSLSSTLWMPCFKQYLFSHIRTKIIDIPIADWKDVIRVPVIGFQKSSASNVYKISKRKY